MPEKMEVPKTTLERMEETAPDAGTKMMYPADSKKWFDRKLNEDMKKTEMWSNGLDPRFPQQNVARYCWTYFLDFNRCKTLKGEDYAPCQYFKNVYEEYCPKFWVDKWDGWVDEGRFPAFFDR